MAGDFNRNLSIGKKAELFAESYFKKQNILYQDVRDDREYQKIDVDYVADKYNKVEVKCNYGDARYGRKGIYFWVELQVGKNKGWWYFSQADYFFFNDTEKSGIIVENNCTFKDFVNNAVECGDHGSYGNNRIDRIKDKRYHGDIDVVNMRVYLEDIVNLAGVNLTKIAKRQRISESQNL